MKIRGASIHKATDVKFVGEAGSDRGGLTTEMLSEFFGKLFPSVDQEVDEMELAVVGAAIAESKSGAATGGGGGNEAPCGVSLFELVEGSSSVYWLPKAGLHKQANGRQQLQQLRAIGRIMCKCLLELHAIPQVLPPIVFAVLAYGGDMSNLVRDIIPSQAEAQTQADECETEALMPALELLRPYDPAVYDSLSNLLRNPITADVNFTIGDLLGDISLEQPTMEELMASLPDEDDEDDEDEEEGSAGPTAEISQPMPQPQDQEVDSAAGVGLEAVGGPNAAAQARLEEMITEQNKREVCLLHLPHLPLAAPASFLAPNLPTSHRWLYRR